MKEQQRKSLPLIMLISAIILTASALFSFAADLPHVFIVALLLLTISMLTRRPVKISDRSIIYTVVSTLVLTVLLDYLFPLNNSRFGFIGTFFHPEIVVPVVTFAAAFMTFFRPGQYLIGSAAAAALITLTFGGDVLDVNTVHERLPMFTPLMKHFNTVYIAVIVIVSILILAGYRSAQTEPVITEYRSVCRWRRLALLLVMIFLPLLVMISWKLYRQYEGQLRRIENYFTLSGRNRWGQQQSVMFGREVDLKRTINPETLKNQAQVVLRVKASSTPGYLRGYAYVNYASGLWVESKKPNPLSMNSKRQPGILAFKTFYFKDNAAKGNSALDIIMARGFISRALLTPANLTQVETIANNMSYSRDGVLEPQDWDKDGGYTIWRAKDEFQPAWSEPATIVDDEYLNIPPKLRPQLQQFISSIPEFKQLNERGNDKINTELVLKYLSDNYKYSVESRNISGEDPIIYFLTVSKRGHCELYASATALILRTINIPTRYVTGFVCTELNSAGKYYVARLGNAHAWLEYFNRDSRQWLPLEPTPASGTPNFQHETGTWDGAADRMILLMQQILADLRRGYFAKIVVDFFEFTADICVSLFWHPVRGTVGFLIMITLAVWLRRYYSRRCINPAYISHLHTIELSRIYCRYVKKLIKHYRLPISTQTTTVSELCLMVKNIEPDENIATVIVNALRKYQDCRFSQQPPSAQEIQDFKLQFKSLPYS
jgi:hypothetical protein